MNKFGSLILKIWLTPKFPQKHIERIYAYKPGGLMNKIRNFYRTWVAHPIKRRIAKYYTWYLRSFFGLKVVGVTGSAGKTSTKEMLAAIFKLEGETVYSYANIDPIYNIPTTMLRCRPSTKYLILEMGVEYPGEMDFYLWLAKPDVGIITNIYPTHTLFFKNVDGVFKEKSKLVRGLSKDAFAILNFQNKHLVGLKNKLKANIVWFGDNSEISAINIRVTKGFKTKFVLNIGGNRGEVILAVLGGQFVENAFAAAAAASALNINSEKIKRGLENFRNQEHRMNIRKLRSGAILIDDSYNNNPEAARKAIEILRETAGNKKTMLVFGDMLELGKDEVKRHLEIAKFILSKKVDYVVGVGPLSKRIVANKNNWAADWVDAIPIVKSFVTKRMVILVKGSRSMGLDNLVAALK